MSLHCRHESKSTCCWLIFESYCYSGTESTFTLGTVRPSSLRCITGKRSKTTGCGLYLREHLSWYWCYWQVARMWKEFCHDYQGVAVMTHFSSKRYELMYQSKTFAITSCISIISHPVEMITKRSAHIRFRTLTICGIFMSCKQNTKMHMYVDFTQSSCLATQTFRISDSVTLENIHLLWMRLRPKESCHKRLQLELISQLIFQK